MSGCLDGFYFLAIGDRAVRTMAEQVSVEQAMELLGHMASGGRIGSYNAQNTCASLPSSRQ